ncbi:MAG: elongation factor P maturation arginine rhamnosyltransferase EarP [Rhodocyclaceae bacterium]|nr:elongation factor P maturation arginine rhamnosyltransferase EarP [Rhodocyclaceae bacterium]
MSQQGRALRPVAGAWDVFCRVVDNFGDIGVCWRLCRILVREFGIPVRLVVDRPEYLERIGGDPHIVSNAATGADISVVEWSDALLPTSDTGVVIEAFACDLPAGYALRMAADGVSRLWINLEYLSAEAWIEDCHGLVSRHPQLGLDKHFLFPGFTARTAGLLRETDLRGQRDRFRTDPAARASTWLALGMGAPGPGEHRASLFGYENPAAGPLLDAMAGGDTPWTVLVPEGRSCAGLAAIFGVSLSSPGDAVVRGALRVQVVPFTGQDAYDRLLWACDLNLVRGEDSLVRALWAGRPFLWQAYPQSDRAHLDKVEALLLRLSDGVGDTLATDRLGLAMRAWNGVPVGGDPWTTLLADLPALCVGVERWSVALEGGPELAETLVNLTESRVI